MRPCTTPAAQARGEPSYMSENTGRIRILVVDDDISVLEVETEILNALGYRVTGQSNPMKALESFCNKPHAYDLVITDFHMPGMNGAELCGRIKTIRPDIPKIIVSGFQEIDNKTARGLGIHGTITKPLKIRDLAACVKEALEAGAGSKTKDVNHGFIL